MKFTNKKMNNSKASQKRGIVRQSSLVSLYVTVMISIIVLFRVFTSPPVGSELEIFVRYITSVLALYIFFFMFFLVYFYFKPDSFSENNE